MTASSGFFFCRCWLRNNGHKQGGSLTHFVLSTTATMSLKNQTEGRKSWFKHQGYSRWGILFWEVIHIEVNMQSTIRLPPLLLPNALHSLSSPFLPVSFPSPLSAHLGPFTSSLNSCMTLSCELSWLPRHCRIILLPHSFHSIKSDAMYTTPCSVPKHFKEPKSLENRYRVNKGKIRTVNWKIG